MKTHWQKSLFVPIGVLAISFIISYLMPFQFKHSLEGGIIVVTGFILGALFSLLFASASFYHNEKYKYVSLILALPSLLWLLVFSLHLLGF